MIVLDGCPQKCAAKTLEHVDIKPHVYPYCPKTHSAAILAWFAPPQQTGPPASRG